MFVTEAILQALQIGGFRWQHQTDMDGTMVRGKRTGLVLAVMSAMILTGCGGLDYAGQSYRGTGSHLWLDNAASGSRHAETLTWSDKREIDTAALSAAQASTPRAEITWSNPATGSFGSARSGLAWLVGFNAGAEVETPFGLQIDTRLQPVAGDYVTNTNANVRLGPHTGAARASLLPEGSLVKVIAREPVEGWYLVVARKKVIGYVFGDLITQTGGGDLLLAGGDSQFPKVCREMTYKVSFSDGRTDEWLNGACREGRQSWAIVGGRALEAAG